MIVLYVALLLLISSALLGVLWWFRLHPRVPQEVGWDEVMAAADRGGYRLISTEKMSERFLKDPQSMLLVDTRPAEEYRGGHIRGAVNLPLTPTWWGRWRSRRLLSALLGPDKERLVIFY